MFQGTDCKDRAEGAEYRGKVSRTRGGQQCVSWKIMSRLVAINPLHFADDNLEDAANFCRNPNGKHTEPWCYTDRQGAAWEACDIPFCGDVYGDRFQTVPQIIKRQSGKAKDRNSEPGEGVPHSSTD